MQETDENSSDDVVGDLLNELEHAQTPVEAVSRWLFNNGGRMVYLPKRLKSQQQQIKNAFNGKNAAFLCAKYAISERTLRRIVRHK